MENVQDIYPLSPMQQGMLFHTLYAPESANYTEQMSAEFNGPLNITAFRQAWQCVLDRHDVLRSAFVWEDVDEPLQVVHESLEIPFELLDWSGIPDETFRDRFEKLKIKEREQGFDLTDAPLLRVKIVKQDAHRHGFLFTYHHILLDGWAMPIVLGELFSLYDANDKNKTPDLPPVRPFKHYIAWLREQDKDQADRFWRDRLSGFYSTTPLVVDHPPLEGVRPYIKKHYECGVETSQALHSFVRENKLTLNTVMQGALGLVLAYYNRTDDVVFGATVSGRPSEIPGIESMVGLFINTLPVRARFDYREKLIDYLKRLHAEQNEARVYEYTPLVDIKKVSELSDDQPLFETLFVFENYPVDESVKQQKSDIHITDVAVFERSNYPLTVVASSGMPLALQMAFDTARLSEKAVDRLAGHLIRVLQTLIEQPDVSIKDIRFITEAEEKKLLEEMNATRRPYPADKTAIQLFEKMVALYPRNRAVEHNDDHLTYEALNHRANGWAAYLRKQGVTPGGFVALCLPRSVDMITATLAILKCGAVYIPIDMEYPVERIQYIVNDSNAGHVITTDAIHDAAGLDVTLISLKELRQQEAVNENPPVMISADAPAYMIYTSGSTGKPKGVLLHHKGLSNTIHAQIEDFGITPQSNGLQFASYGFDAAVSEVFSCLMAGATLHIVEKETILNIDAFSAFLKEHKISYVTLPPSLLTLLANRDFPDLKTVISVGEACSRALAQKWKDRYRFINGYGPTEATIGCVWSVVENLPVEARTAPIGRPIYNDRVYIVDPFMRPTPVGVPGELCIASPGLAIGYHKRPDLTAEKFINNPFSTDEGARIYRSGDLARWLDDGVIEFIGRIDFQVKIRGNRIELGEIEAVLNDYEAVRDAVVIALGDAPERMRLAAYIIPAGDSVDLTALRGYLTEKLPDYMQPAAITVMQAFPLTHNGKVNRRALPEPDWEAQSEDNTTTAATTPVEDVLLSLWRDVLGVTTLSVHDNFFHLGGHSLLATQLVSRIRDAFDVEIPLKKLFEQPTVAHLAGLIQQARQNERGFTLPPLTAGPRPEHIPLSFAQQRLWFLDQLQPGGTFYNIPSAFRIEGPLQDKALENALASLMQRHEILRTTFAENGGKPRQIIHEDMPLPLSREDLSDVPRTTLDDEIRERVRKDALHVFDLTTGPLWRACLYNIGDNQHIFSLNLHHSIADGWSMGIFMAELAELYRSAVEGSPARLPDLEVQYADYALWQQNWLQGEILTQQLNYWRETIGEDPPVLELPLDCPRPAVQTFNGAALTHTLPDDLSRKIFEESAAFGVTPYMLMLAAFQALLHRYSGQDTVIVGSPVANRNHSGTEGLIGFFVNNLIIKSDFSQQQAFETLLLDVRDTMLEAYAHQDVPFEKIVDALVTRRDTSHAPIFQVMFVYQNLPQQEATTSDIHLQQLEYESVTSKFDLSVTINPAETGMAWQFEYNTDLFNADTIERMMHHYENFLREALEDSEQYIHEIDYLSEEETRLLTENWNRTSSPFEQEKCVHERFAMHVSAQPDHPALQFGEKRMSYRELDQRSSELAAQLLEKGVHTETRVGICLHRSFEMFISILGVMKAGGAYLPLDPGYPSERLAYMMDDARTPVVLTSGDTQTLLEPVITTLQQPPVLLNVEELTTAPPSASLPDISPENLAYVIYTSGSTGRPKGTLLNHKGLVNLAEIQRQKFGISPQSRILQFSSFSFDASVWELVMALLNGATLVLMQQETAVSGDALTDLMAQQSVTTVTLPPSVLSVFPDKELPDLQTIITAGEACSAELVKKWGRGRRFFNAYGPTETTVCASMYEASPEADTAPPIGNANPNFRLYVLDDHGALVPVGIPGELCVGGVGLARGYHNRPELTAEKFIPDRYSGIPGARLYRTGDLVKRRPDGNIEFLGRIDHQVKVRGFRIELGEIEAVLAGMDGIRDVIVLAREDRPGEKRLVAYCVTDPSMEINVSAVKNHARKHLPDYMVPVHFMMLASMPLTPNGKVDRKALPAPEGDRSQLNVEFIAPRNETEEKLAAIVSELLHVEKVGVYDNFFDLGGHSLLATQFMSRIRSTFDIELPLMTLFEKPTIADLSDQVEIARASGMKAKPKIEKIERAARPTARRPARRSRK
ncbi:MAG: amino acid adenylation domain-containing protein [Calditrichaeota bacterium]|nr:MAG: amino acid adenylation domain-containing protein [Calditrichota bacterium]